MPSSYFSGKSFMMKILAIGRNYAAHIEELNNQNLGEPVIFTKPDTALIHRNQPFFYPKYSNDIHYEVEVLLKICKVGKNIDKKFASDYYDEIGLGIDFTARDLQKKAKDNGLPWTISKGFDGSAPISKFFDKQDFDLSNLDFGLHKNGTGVQQGNTSMMLYDFDYIISYLSKFFTLKRGDIIFTGTPEGVGPVKIGDRLEGFLHNKKVLKVDIK